MLRDSDTIHRRNQHPASPLSFFLILHPAYQKLRETPRYLRPLRLLLRQKYLQVRIPPAQVRDKRTVA
jgi:hypothetical protein